MTKEEQLVERLALEKGVRMGICACLTNLVVEHAKVVGGDQSKALATIRAALDNTVVSFNVKAEDAAGTAVEISDVVQRSVSEMLDPVFREAQKRLSRGTH